ncbi:hypothetical protein A5714_02300 [Mycobacterium sp. E2462]|nr:hypothetical protein A5700_21735 [Mycobacterium sp. E1214]OBH24479.1 hypothetical protein A5693_07975 [Mycobacterium sp. E1319]OBI06573.1 hypothetical protein A5714_02300 [Mycobacterium sp. E2462]
MAIVDRFNIKVVASAGLCGAAIALSPDAAAAPLITGGHACIEGQAGEAPFVAGAPAAGGAPAAAGACAAPLTDMSGVPLAVPGPLPLVPPVPVVPPVPIAPPIPVVPAGAPLVALAGPADGLPAAPIIDMSGVKDVTTGPAPSGGPVPGQPVPAGPAS